MPLEIGEFFGLWGGYEKICRVRSFLNGKIVEFRGLVRRA
jgi:hypothetical protein